DTHALQSPVRPSGQSRCAPGTRGGVRIWRPSPRARSNCLERLFPRFRANPLASKARITVIGTIFRRAQRSAFFCLGACDAATLWQPQIASDAVPLDARGDGSAISANREEYAS